MKPFNNFCCGPFTFGHSFGLTRFHSVNISYGFILLVRVMILHVFPNFHVWWLLILVWCLNYCVRPTNVYYVLLYLMRASAGLTSWKTSEFHSRVKLEVLYMFCKIPTSLSTLFYVQSFLRYLYILVGFNHILLFLSIMDVVGAFQKLPRWQLYRVNLSYNDILKIRTYELSY